MGNFRFNFFGISRSSDCNSSSIHFAPIKINCLMSMTKMCTPPFFLLGLKRQWKKGGKAISLESLPPIRHLHVQASRMTGSWNFILAAHFLCFTIITVLALIAFSRIPVPSVIPHPQYLSYSLANICCYDLQCAVFVYPTSN